MSYPSRRGAPDGSLRHRADSKIMIYFLQIGQGSIKIGKSVDICHRLTVLQISCPDILTVLAVIPTESDDHIYHDRFYKFWIRGEWFSPAQPLLNFIASIPKSEYTGLTVGTGLKDGLRHPRSTDAPKPDRRPAFLTKPSRPEPIHEDLIHGIPSIEQLEAVVADTPDKERLIMMFQFSNPLEFCSYLHAMEVSDAVASKLLAWKVMIPSADNDLLVRQACDQAMVHFWDRLAVEQEVAHAS